ncbi:MAG: transcriptional repressor NrdR [Kiritimatiellae bacterium]|nr:transcriptional repressor NrdR [Kiritimatiellia bacterium]
MKCPACGADNDRVLDSRPARDGAAVRRRRECSACGVRYTTFEEIADDITVVKTDGRREPFDRSKIDRAVRKSCGKLPIGDMQIRALTDAVVARLPRGDEVSSSRIAGLVMDELRKTDDVAYIRFASVYRKFTDVSQFVDEVTGISGK